VDILLTTNECEDKIIASSKRAWKIEQESKFTWSRAFNFISFL